MQLLRFLRCALCCLMVFYYFDLNPCVSANSQPGSEASSDSSEDVDYMPEEDKENKKVIQVGHDYQATVPEGFYHYGDAPPYENEDRLLWNPSKIEEDNCESPPSLSLSLSLCSLSLLLSSPSPMEIHVPFLSSRDWNDNVAVVVCLLSTFAVTVTKRVIFLAVEFCLSDAKYW